MRRRRLSAGKGALLGALAGVAGGFATVAARSVGRAALGSGESHEPGWEQVVRAEAVRQGVELGEPEVRRIATAAHLADAATLGALYGLVRARLPLPRVANGLLLSGLAQALDLPRLALALAGGPVPPRGASSLERSLLPVGAHGVYGYVTTRAFDLLAARAPR